MPVSDPFYNVEVQKICAISDERQEFWGQSKVPDYLLWHFTLTPSLQATKHPGRLRAQVRVVGRTNQGAGSHV